MEALWKKKKKKPHYSFAFLVTDDNAEGWSSLKTWCSCIYRPRPGSTASEHWDENPLPMPWHFTYSWNLDIIQGGWEWEEKTLWWSGFKPKWTDSPFFNLGRFHIKVHISSLPYKIRRSGNTRDSFWPWIFLLEMRIICLYKLSSPVFFFFPSISTTP